jgi:transcriptional regulator with GAF, ATPase, and Fis domain
LVALTPSAPKFVARTCTSWTVHECIPVIDSHQIDGVARPRDYRFVVAACSGLVVAYSIFVLWYVATCPEIGLRCLLPERVPAQGRPGLPIAQFVGPDISPAPAAGDQLLTINREPVETFLDFVERVTELRSATISPGGQLSPGSDPLELSVPGLVEIFNTDEAAAPQRLVELTFLPGGPGDSQFAQAAWVPLGPVSVLEISLTIIWFVCQLAILAFGLAAFWQRPFDRVARNFSLMCCASMGAFVAGFHWWILAGNPILNLPFIICAAMLPSLVLYFFLMFPRESRFMQGRRRLIQWSIFGPASAMCLLLIVVYWSAWSLNQGAGTDRELTLLQKSVVLSRMLLTNMSQPTDLQAVSNWTLVTLRQVIHAAIVLGSIYFGLTVAQLISCLFRLQSPLERRQTFTILVAAVIATIPISYTLYLALFRELDFALGRAQLPMFLASMLFMAAYAHGMLRHRLILVDASIDRAGRYWLMSVVVSGGFATCLAVGGVAAHSYSLPLNSGLAQQVSLFLILCLAAALGLWVRDRLQAVVDRRFFSEKYQLDRTLQQLNRAAGYLTDPSGMADITVRTCQDIVDASWACMFVRDGQGVFRLVTASGGISAPTVLKSDVIQSVQAENVVVSRQPSSNRESMSPIQKLLHDMKAELACALQDESGLHGVVLVGGRRSGAAYTAEDVAFLQAIAQMSVLALHSSRANQNLARLDAELKVKVDRIAEQQRQLSLLRAELTSLQQDAGQNSVAQPTREIDRDEMRGNAPALLNVLSQVGRVAQSSATVLIRGESGTGKELLARIIHRNSDRASAPLVSLNCAALAPSLLESELFGHVKGAFTGAHADKAGRFVAADGGTLFLDEIGDISHETQVKLLRVLQERCLEPVGSDSTVEVDVRLIAATNRNLEQMMEAGEFREDLYYRLNVVSLTLPALRERSEDLIELVFYFLNRAGQRTRKQIRQIDPAALEALERHTWPGNIRELENVIERAVVMAESDVVTLGDLPPELQNSVHAPAVAAVKVVTPAAAPSQSAAYQLDKGRGDSKRPAFPTSLEPDAEAQLLREALTAAGGNKARAARSLNLPRSTFFSKCRKYGIN